MGTLTNKRILLGVTGGIAAYKSADTVRRLREAGAEVRVVMTAGAAEFITALTLQAVSGHPVYQHLLDTNAEAGMGHIELARWADAVLVAPASANFMARLAQGRADDLLSAVCLATESPVTVAPAMNQQMWSNNATQANLATLKKNGVRCRPGGRLAGLRRSRARPHAGAGGTRHAGGGAVRRRRTRRPPRRGHGRSHLGSHRPGCGR